MLQVNIKLMIEVRSHVVLPSQYFCLSKPFLWLDKQIALKPTSCLFRQAAVLKLTSNAAILEQST